MEGRNVLSLDLEWELTNIDAIEGLRVEYKDGVNNDHISQPLIINNFNLGLVDKVKMKQIEGYEFQDVEIIDKGILSSKILSIRFTYLKKRYVDLLYTDETGLIFLKERVYGVDNQVKSITLSSKGNYCPSKKDILIKFVRDGEVKVRYEHIDYQIRKIDNKIIQINKELRKRRGI